MVMTTEVLRNMLYAGSGTLAGLGYVVMDEVHYLADRSRGAVWEEVIIHLPESVVLVSLSATVSNAEEFGEWLETVRGDTVDHRRGASSGPALPARPGRAADARPVRDLRRRRRRRLRQGGRPGQRRAAPDRARRLRQHPAARPTYAEGQGSAGRGRGRPVGNGRRVWIPSRVDVLDQLDAAGLLPAIVFIFSRVGCDAAVQQCLRSGHPPDDAGGARRDPRLRRGGVCRPARRGPRRPRLPRLPATA